MQTEVRVLIVDGSAEDGLSRSAADSSGDVLFPDGRALLIRIERPDDRLLGRGNDYGTSVRHRSQARRRRVIPVRSGLLDAIVGWVRRLISSPGKLSATPGSHRTAGDCLDTASV